MVNERQQLRVRFTVLGATREGHVVGQDSDDQWYRSVGRTGKVVTVKVDGFPPVGDFYLRLTTADVRWAERTDR